MFLDQKRGIGRERQVSGKSTDLLNEQQEVQMIGFIWDYQRNARKISTRSVMLLANEDQQNWRNGSAVKTQTQTAALNRLSILVDAPIFSCNIED